jgi:hypothetical protein
MSILVRVDVKAPMPLMHPRAAERFNRLREIVRAGAGFDFLAVCGDICRASNFVSNKDGVANRSWHKTGRAFDYDQNSKTIVIVSEPRNGKQFFRTYLKCVKQDGSLGSKLTVRDMRGFNVSAYLFDFTAAAESVGFERIPAWSGWQRNYNRREFWHYQYVPDGLTWEEAMSEIKRNSTLPQTPKPPTERIISLNDRGEIVRVEQTRLAKLGLLPQSEVDGVFGAKTKQAVIDFQRKYGLGVDGHIGMKTRAKLKELVGSTI